MFMKLFTLLTCLLSLPALASTLTCDLVENSEPKIQRHFDIHPGQKVQVGVLESQTIFLKRKTASLYEIEVFNPMIPSRNYSQAVIRGFKDVIAWANWSRESLISIKCYLYKRI